MGREEAKFRFCTGLNFLDPVIGDNFLLTLFFFGGDDEKVVTSMSQVTMAVIMTIVMMT